MQLGLHTRKENDMQTCTRCVMNNASDPLISFDENGYCNYCSEALAQKEERYFPNKKGREKIAQLVHQLKEEGKNRQYDCLMGLSGGLDSSYLAYLGAEKWGLRIAAVHIDDGYDTSISKENVRKLAAQPGIDLITIRPDAEQFNDLTLAYMKAGVPNLAAPQDNIMLASLYNFAKRNKIRNFLLGTNYALECILQRGNTWNAYDKVNIMDIHKKFGTKEIDRLNFISVFQRRFDSWTLRVKNHAPLDWVDYNRDRAFAELKDYCGFEYYGRKHLENSLTAFIQLCWFPSKFGVDKRTSHLSSMIMSNQLTREEALEELREPLYEESSMNAIKNLICANMNISREYLETLIEAPGHQHDEYKIDERFLLLSNLKRTLKARRPAQR